MRWRHASAGADKPALLFPMAMEFLTAPLGLIGVAAAPRPRLRPAAALPYPSPPVTNYSEPRPWKLPPST